MPIYDTGVRRYPVVVSTTNHHLVWYEALDHPFDSDYDVRIPEPWEYQGTVYSLRIGPMNQCQKCGGRQYYILSGIAHADNCPDLPTTGDTVGN
jgi:hypothetical protein